MNEKLTNIFCAVVMGCYFIGVFALYLALFTLLIIFPIVKLVNLLVEVV